MGHILLNTVNQCKPFLLHVAFVTATGKGTNTTGDLTTGDAIFYIWKIGISLGLNFWVSVSMTDTRSTR